MDRAKSETFKNFTISNKASLFLIKSNKEHSLLNDSHNFIFFKICTRLPTGITLVVKAIIRKLFVKGQVFCLCFYHAVRANE